MSDTNIESGAPDFKAAMALIALVTDPKAAAARLADLQSAEAAVPAANLVLQL